MMFVGFLLIVGIVGFFVNGVVVGLYVVIV